MLPLVEAALIILELEAVMRAQYLLCRLEGNSHTVLSSIFVSITD